MQNSDLASESNSLVVLPFPHILTHLPPEAFGSFPLPRQIGQALSPALLPLQPLMFLSFLLMLPPQLLKDLNI